MGERGRIRLNKDARATAWAHRTQLLTFRMSSCCSYFYFFFNM
jgi:hypothetical protein